MNQELFDLKVSLLEKVKNPSFYNSKSLFQFSCNYHGVDIVFNCDDQHFLYDIKSHIPQSWANEQIFGQQIYVTSPRFFNISEDDFCREESQDCINFDGANNVVQRDFAAITDDDKIHLICELKVCDGLFNFLRWYLPRKLIRNKSFILHSSCVLDEDDKAHFFLGHSGAGKTTLTSLSSPRKILGDDMNIIRIQDGKILARAGAIGGAMKPQVDYDSSFEVKSFNWIIQSDENSRSLIDKKNSKLKIIASITNIFWELLSDEDIKFLLDSVSTLNNSIPVYELSFQKSNSFWTLIES